MATMKLILLQDVEDLGLAGDEINVAAGFGRNYLIPRKLAAVATTSALRQLAAHKEKIEAKRKEELAAAQTLAAKIAELNVTISAQASDDGHLFGSVSARTIADAVKALGFEIDHQRFHLETAIRATGEYQVPVKLHTNVIQQIKVTVVPAV